MSSFDRMERSRIRAMRAHQREQQDQVAEAVRWGWFFLVLAIVTFLATSL